MAISPGPDAILERCSFAVQCWGSKGSLSDTPMGHSDERSDGKCVLAVLALASDHHLPLPRSAPPS